MENITFFFLQNVTVFASFTKRITAQYLFTFLSFDITSMLDT